MRQQREAKMHSDNLTALNTSLRTSLGKLDSADDAAMATAYRAARDTVLAPAVTDATAWVAEQKAGFTRGFSAEGRVFACTDPDMSRQLAKVAKGLGDLPEVNATPPSNVAITNSEGMLLGFARVFGFGDDKLAQGSDFAPIAIPAHVNVMFPAHAGMNRMLP